MIRTRLTLTFAILVLLAFAQGLFTVWATKTASLSAERSVVATGLLNNYLDLGASKQQLKVWFAQYTLTGDAPKKVRDALLVKMAASLAELKALTVRDLMLTPRPSGGEQSTVESLKINFDALKSAIIAASARQPEASAAQAWSNLILVFDRSDGRDVRTILDAAIQRQRLESEAAKTGLDQALSRTRIASIALAGIVTILGMIAVTYFVRRLQRPFDVLVEATEAIATGNYEHRSDARRNDEFGLIARRLNDTAGKLAEAQRSSESIRLALDEAVTARTADLTKSYETLIKIDARRRTFFADISHELRTPVTVIRGEAEVSLRGPDRDANDYQATLRRIVDASVQLSDRVSELLQLARDDAEQAVFNLVPCGLSDIVTAALHKSNAIAAYRNVRLSLISELTYEYFNRRGRCSCFRLFRAWAESRGIPDGRCSHR